MTTDLANVAALYNQVGSDFLIAELDLAITFCQVGLTTQDLNRAERNADNAREALRAILRTKERISLTGEGREMVVAKTSKLALLLVQLEQRLISSDL